MKLSIVVPIGHKDQNFKLLDQLKDKFKDHEIIAACSSQNFEAKKLEEHVDKFLTIQNSTRAKALNIGAEAANNSLLWFIHLDSDLSLINPSDLEKIDKEKINTFLLKFDNEKLRLNAKSANFRTKYLGLPFGDQSFIVHKKLFNFIGEFTIGLYEGEDHEFIWKAKSVGIKINVLENYVISSAAKYILNPVSQTLTTLSKTISQIIKFRKPRTTNVICYFIKDPKSLKSKTRLRKELTEKFVSELNENLIEIVANNIKKIKANKSIHQITVSEKIHKDYAFEFSKITNGIYLTEQKELGSTMKELVEFNLKYFQKVVIVGSDIPSLTAKDITDSLKVRSAKNIFYPTLDGGFCLLATSDNKILDVLDIIKYGTDSVLGNLTKNLSHIYINNKFYQDIDVKEDLTKIYQSLKDNAYSINATRKKLYTLLYANQKQFSE
ncbi:DUF2064 domain-containing protein [Candidatus Pelagibacter sp.]|nr:DUF2064 domain-containing protein [Candidatus Pelagibacter sp.]